MILQPQPQPGGGSLLVLLFYVVVNVLNLAATFQWIRNELLLGISTLTSEASISKRGNDELVDTYRYSQTPPTQRSLHVPEELYRMIPASSRRPDRSFLTSEQGAAP